MKAFAVFDPSVLRVKPGAMAIYALIDPRDLTVRYVGASANPRARLYSQISEPSHNRRKVDWMSELRSKGHEPMMVVLERESVFRYPAAERRWIAFYRTRGDLLNVHAGDADVTGMIAKRRRAA